MQTFYQEYNVDSVNIFKLLRNNMYYFFKDVEEPLHDIHIYMNLRRLELQIAVCCIVFVFTLNGIDFH